jgi:hypothetical protein
MPANPTDILIINSVTTILPIVLALGVRAAKGIRFLKNH